MSRAGHERVGAIFSGARRLPPSQRAAYLDEACADDADLRREVESLLGEHDEGSGFLDTQHLREKLGEAAAESLAREPAALPETIGPFRIIRLIGEGGMGVVYEARQDDPRRRVALKVIRPGMVTRTLLARFRHEAQILGQLRHPGIAQIHQAGTEDRGEGGQPYFAMELVEGRPLLEYVKANRLSIRDRLGLVALMCDALHHAHQKGVIHRDLKPANILVEEGTNGHAQPKILDFGVARATDADIQTVTLQTDVGQLVGTVPYMSPEQAAGDPSQIDIRSDVYSLGVITYELLTGRLPYDVSGKLIHEAVRVIREVEPSRLSSFDRALRGDIETIVAKCLTKEKERRYQSAAELAADIRRYLEDRPIIARPTSAMYQLRKFARRNKALVSAAVIAFGTMLGATVFSVIQASVAVEAKKTADHEKQIALQQAYRATISAATAALASDEPINARSLLDSVGPQQRNWEWSYLDAKLDQSIAVIDPGEPLAGAALSADGSEVMTVSREGVVRWWRPLEGTERASASLDAEQVRVAVLTPDATTLAALYGPGTTMLGVWALDVEGSARRIGSQEVPAHVYLYSIDISDDGRWVVAGGDNVAWVWDLAAPHKAPLKWSHGIQKASLSLSTDGGRAAVVGAAPGIQRAAIRATTGDVIKHGRHARDLRWGVLSPDGALLASGGLDKLVRVRDVETFEVLQEWSGHDDVPVALAFSPDGRWIASGGGDLTLRLWNVESGRPGAVLTGHERAIRDVRFSADGARILSLAGDVVRLWNVEPDDSLHVLRGHRSYVYAVAFSPDGTRLYSGSWEGTIRAWDVESGEPISSTLASGVASLAVSPDGGTLASGHFASGGVMLWPTVPLGFPVALGAVGGDASGVAFSPDGRRVAAVGRETVVWDVETKAELARLPGNRTREGELAFSPDGVRLAVAFERGVRVYDTDNGEEVLTIDVPAVVYVVAWSPDGRTIAAGCRDHIVRLFDATSGDVRHTLTGHSNLVYALAFSPDGTRLASGSNDTTIRLWDVVSGEAVAQLRGHQDYIMSLAFAPPDGRLLASGSGDFTVRLWDTRPLRDRVAAQARFRTLLDEVQPLVRALAERMPGDPAGVAEALRSDPELDEPRRRAALALVSGGLPRADVVAVAPFDGHAAEFDGQQQHVLIGNHDDFRMAETFTLEAWINPIDAWGVRAVINKEGEYQLSRGYNGTIMWTTTSGPGWSVWREAGAAAPALTWTHVVLVHGTDAVRVYLNGELAAEFDRPGPLGRDRHPKMNELWIGGRQLGEPGFRGLIDEVRIWNVARSGEEILAHMRSPLGGDEPGLVGYWRFDEGSGSIAHDETGRHHGTLVGATWHSTGIR